MFVVLVISLMFATRTIKHHKDVMAFVLIIYITLIASMMSIV